MSAVAGVLVAVGLLGAPGVASGASGGGGGLPDGRAWEMVSPLEKNGGLIRGIEKDINGGGVVQATPSGNAITYASQIAFGNSQGAPVGSQYVGTRNPAEGWLTQNITTPSSDQAYILGGPGTPYRAFSSDLSSGLVFGGHRRGVGHPVESPPLTPGAPAGYEDFYLYGIPGGALRSLLTEPPGVPAGAFGLQFLGATPDLSHVVLKSATALAGDAVEGAFNHYNLYDWEAATGRFQTVNIPPGSTTSEPEEVMLLGSQGNAVERAISEDGSRVVWTTARHLYVREGIGTGHPATVQADAPAGGGEFLTASSDDTKIFFSDLKKLTGESSSGNSADLYRFEPEGSRLVDLTVDRVDPGGAEVLGVLGASADGSSVYFVANGRLAVNAPLGNCEPGFSVPGRRCNLFLWHEGWREPRFIAALSGKDNAGDDPELGVALDWESSVRKRTVRVSRDGMRVVFMSEEPLTGYDNTVGTGDSCGTTLNRVRLPVRCQEVFLYEAGGSEVAPGRLSCVSCNSSGARPSGPSGIPGGTTFEQSSALYQSRVLSEGEGVGGRVFFDSADALVPWDTNGVEDVYEYENGHVFLLSDGKSAQGASFVDASVNGNDAFFVTRAQLVAQDTDQLVDLYDARAPHGVGERVGFPVAPVVACEGEGCRPAAPMVPLFTAPSSVTFSGPGNVAGVTPAVVAKHKVKVKRRRRPVRRGKRTGRRGGRGGRGVR